MGWACRRAAALDDAELAASALELAWAVFSIRGPFSVGVELVTVVRDIPGLGTAAIAKVGLVAGRALEACGKFPEASVQFKASLEGACAVGHRRCECRALNGLGKLDILGGHLESARTDLEAALAIAYELKNARLQSDVHKGLGTLEWWLERKG